MGTALPPPVEVGLLLTSGTSACAARSHSHQHQWRRRSLQQKILATEKESPFGIHKSNPVPCLLIYLPSQTTSMIDESDSSTAVTPAKVFDFGAPGSPTFTEYFPRAKTFGRNSAPLIRNV